MTEEMIDVLDEKGEQTGRTATRTEVHTEGLWHRIAVVAVLDDKNRILLQQRSKDKITNPNKWDISAAGHIEAGEDALTSAMRETAEEVGIKAEVSKFRFLLSYRKTSHHKHQDMEIIDKQFFDCFVLKVSEKDAQCITLQTSEVQAARFFGMEEFRKMLADGIMVNRKPVYDAILDIILGKEIAGELDDNRLREIIIVLEDIARMLVLNPIKEQKEKPNGAK